MQQHRRDPLGFLLSYEPEADDTPCTTCDYRGRCRFSGETCAAFDVFIDGDDWRGTERKRAG